MAVTGDFVFLIGFGVSGIPPSNYVPPVVVVPPNPPTYVPSLAFSDARNSMYL